MRVLVATASRHGATRNIGSWIASAMVADARSIDFPIDVDLRDVHSLDSVDGYDAAVLGSAVYMGRWMKAARSFVAHEQSSLESIPVWLFSSGPIGMSPASGSPTTGGKTPWAIEHKTFGGKIDLDAPSRHERFIARMIRAETGDDRSRADVDQWASSIVRSLAPKHPTAGRAR